MNNMRKSIIFLFLMIFMVSCGVAEKEKIYKNTDFGYSITYPSDYYQARELKWVKESTGVILRKKEGFVTVQAMAAGTDYEAMPFDEYVRIAAVSEIQNYEKLVSIESFISEYGIKGYRTYWEVIQHEDTDAGSIDKVITVGPIYYFPPRQKQKVGEQPVKTIMISCDPSPGKEAILQEETEEIAASFRYLNSFKTFFRDGDHGGLFFVERGKPFRIELSANPTTGYNWYITEMDESFFKVRSSGYNAAASGMIGTGGTSYWVIVPLKEGISGIRLLYYRPWQGKDKAVEEYKIRVLSR